MMIAQAFVPVAVAETLHIEQRGSAGGDPVVIIPGLFGSGFSFRKVIEPLAESGHHVIVIEPLGTGFSGRPQKADYSLSAQAARVAAALDSLHAPPAVVLAHSIGGAIAFRLAVLRPDLVRGIVSIEGGPTETAVTSGFKSALRYVPWIKWLGGVSLIRRKVRGMLVSSSGDPSWVTDGVVLSYTAGEARDVDRALTAFLAMGKAREPAPLAPQLPRVRCPVALMVGTARHEGDVDPKEVMLLSRSLADFTVDSEAGAGHYLQEERPGAVVAAVERVAARSR